MTDHYTPIEVVQECLQFLQIDKTDSVVDAGSGTNKVWYNSITITNDKDECEIEEGNDFLQYNKKVDWVVGNPPYHVGWVFTEHSSHIAQKGIGFLCSLQTLNSNFIPHRLKTMNDNGFYITNIHVLNIKKWFGRYFFIVYQKNKSNNTNITYSLKYF